ALPAIDASVVPAATSAAVGSWPSAEPVAVSETTTISTRAFAMQCCLAIQTPFNGSGRLFPARRRLPITTNGVCARDDVLVVVLDDQLEIRTQVWRRAPDAEPCARGLGPDRPSQERLVTPAPRERTLRVARL